MKFGQRAGIERSKIAKIEKGVRGVQSAEAATLASALGLDPMELLAPRELIRMRVNPELPATEKAIACAVRKLS